MRSVTKCAALATILAAAITAAPAVASHAAVPPAVRVSPHAGLVGGQTVHLTGTGITPNASVAVNECEDYFFNPDADCNDLTTTTATSTGTVSLDVKVANLVYRNIERGDPIPDYCRADGCHLFLIWTDGDGVMQLASSVALQFQGAPAHIHVHPATDLLGTQRLAVNGSAHGAVGQHVQVLEQICYQFSEGSGCYGQKKALTTTVKSDGTWAVHYQEHRHLPDGSGGEIDCADTANLFGHCVLSVIVLDAAGQPDPSFGDARIGDPAVGLSFHAHPSSQ